MFYGGGQEAGVRPGTENTPMVAGLGEACRLVTVNLAKYSSHMAEVGILVLVLLHILLLPR